MGIRSRIKKRLQKIVHNIIERTIEKDVKSVGVPPTQKEQPYSSDELEALFTADEPQKREETSVHAPKEETIDVISADSSEELFAEEASKEKEEIVESAESISNSEQAIQEEAKTETPDGNELVGSTKKDVEEFVSSSEPTIQEHVVSDSLSSLSTEEKKAQAAQKHLAKTKKGLVQKVLQEGGKMSLPDIHSYSEQRFLIGHKKFSDLLEEMIAEELLCFSYDDGIISLGNSAQSLLS